MHRERKKQKYSNLQGTVEDLASQLEAMARLEEANDQLAGRNEELTEMLEGTRAELEDARGVIAQTGARLSAAESHLAQARVTVQAQEDELSTLRTRLDNCTCAASRRAAAGAAEGEAPLGASAAAAADVTAMGDQLALALRAVLSGIPSQEAAAIQATPEAANLLAALPDSVLAQIRSCCAQVCLHLRKTALKEQPHAIQVPCC